MSAPKPNPGPANEPFGVQAKIAQARARSTSVAAQQPVNQALPQHARGVQAFLQRTRQPHNAPAPTPSPSARFLPPREPARQQQDPEMVSLSGRIIRVLFRDADSGKGLLLVDGGVGLGQFKLQGTLTFEPEAGKRIAAKAKREEHPKYGTQYKSELIIEQLPVDRAGAVSYMARTLDGVGRATAHRIYDLFGEGLYDVLQHEPQRLLGVGGITEPRLKRIVDSWNEDVAVRSIWSFLGRHGVSGAAAARIFSRFGPKSMSVAKNSPYDLAAVEGVGFLTADRIAAENGVAEDSEARIAGALVYALESGGQQGHTSMPASMLVNEVQKLTGLKSSTQAELIRSVLAERIERGILINRVLAGKECVTPAESAQSESSIATRVKSLVDSGKSDEALAEAAEREAQPLNDADQSAAVVNVFRSPVSVITGRPGCGKTTVTKVIAKVASQAGLRVVMCAPTGKAARRIKEATGFEAGTIHSLLRPLQGGSGFHHDAETPLEGDLFLVDEGSMMDNYISDCFFDAIPDGARVVLVGDADQLPSVGAGNVLRDVIASDMVPVAKLQTIHRTALTSDIVVNAHKVINGDVNGVDLKGTKDFRFFEAVDEESIRKATLKRYLDLVDRYGVDGVQVLAARRGTDVGVDALNELLRQAVNPPAPGKPEIERRGSTLRLNDRVMRTSNSKTLGVFNGEVGVITAIDPEAKKVTINFGDRVIVHQGKELSALDLAYAATIHKSQGSEYDGVITVLPQAHQFMLNRNLVYTAMTRGKKQSDLLGDPAVVRTAVGKAGARRFTGLSEELRTSFGAPAAPIPAAAPRAAVNPYRFRAVPQAPAAPSASPPKSAPSQPVPQRTSLFRARP